MITFLNTLTLSVPLKMWKGNKVSASRIQKLAQMGFNTEGAKQVWLLANYLKPTKLTLPWLMMVQLYSTEIHVCLLNDLFPKKLSHLKIISCQSIPCYQCDFGWQYHLIYQQKLNLCILFGTIDKKVFCQHFQHSTWFWLQLVSKYWIFSIQFQ